MLNIGKRVLVAIDGSPQSDKAAEEAVKMVLWSGNAFKSTLHALLVLPGMRAPSFTDFFPLLPATERPDWERALDVPGVRLHLYGKKVAKPGRKMGHLSAVGPTPQAARDAVLDAYARLLPR